MDIVYTSHTAIIIEPNWKKVEEVKTKLGKLKERKIIVVNVHDLGRQFLNNKLTPIKELKELINNPCYFNYLKIFHDCKEEDFSAMLSAFSLHGRDDLKHISGELGNRKMADCYNEYFFKLIPTTVSMKEGLRFQEL